MPMILLHLVGEDPVLGEIEELPAPTATSLNSPQSPETGWKRPALSGRKCNNSYLAYGQGQFY